MIAINGVAAVPVHLKRLLDKLGVRGDFLHIGAFKGAAEPLTRNEPSKEMLETLRAILDASFATLVEGISSGRKLDAAAVRGLIDTALFQGEAAKKAGLVDQVAIYEAYRSERLGETAWRQVKIDKQGPPDMAALMELLGVSRKPRPRDPHIALVYAVGGVVDGKGEGIVGARNQIASRPLTAALRVLGADDTVKAIVVRISSGGGSALSSELIWQAMREVSARKPVVVSMGDVAASGGYYIACGGSKIYAARNALTGSIGVVGGKLVLQDALTKLGVDLYPMGRGKRATMWGSTAAWTAEEREVVRSTMTEVYETFLARVATARNKTRDQVHEIAQGRVWTGADAAERGLVDAIGGLDDAIAEARTLGKLAADAPLEVYPPAPTLMDLLSSMGSFPGVTSAILEEIAQTAGPRAARAIGLALEQARSFGDTPVQATLIFPLVYR
jgi:protease-4